MAVKVAINGFGRIGRNVLRAIIESGRNDIEVVAINDLGPVETNAHLLRYDSVHGRFPATVTVNGDSIDVGRGPIRVTAIRNPADLPWGDVDVVMECTGIRTHVKSTGQIESFRLLPELRFNPIDQQHLLVGIVGNSLEEAGFDRILKIVG